MRAKRIYPSKSLENWRNCCSIGKWGGVTRYLCYHYDCSAEINYSKASNCSRPFRTTKVTSRVARANDHVYTTEYSLKIDEKPPDKGSGRKNDPPRRRIHRRTSVIKYSRFKYRGHWDYYLSIEKKIIWLTKTRACCALGKNCILDNFERNGRKIEMNVTQLTSRAFFLNQPSFIPSIIPRTMYDIGVINRTKGCAMIPKNRFDRSLRIQISYALSIVRFFERLKNDTYLQISIFHNRIYTLYKFERNDSQLNYKSR